VGHRGFAAKLLSELISEFSSILIKWEWGENAQDSPTPDVAKVTEDSEIGLDRRERSCL
jgi:hypothetical protein